jgi:hypothetical protein
MEKVIPKAASGYNMSIASIWGSGPKWAISCGRCEITFKARVPMVDSPGLKCPHCGVINILPIVIGRAG